MTAPNEAKLKLARAVVCLRLSFVLPGAGPAGRTGSSGSTRWTGGAGSTCHRCLPLSESQLAEGSQSGGGRDWGAGVALSPLLAGSVQRRAVA